MKKVLMILMCCAVLSGCNNNKNQIQSSTIEEQNIFDINAEQLESEGYEKIADIAYARIEDGKDTQTVRLIYY